jgi:alpha-L-rhamnosidase
MAETLLGDSAVYTDNLRDARATNTYIPRDSMLFSYCPSTVWQGFRYAQITGLRKPLCADGIRGYVIADGMSETGTFSCSDTLLNNIFAAAKRGIRGNYHSFPTDCPQRDERLGWLGDRFTGCIGESYVFNNKALYLKWLQDIEDAQTESGQLYDIAPRYWGLRPHDNITWTGTYIAVADMLLQGFLEHGGCRVEVTTLDAELIGRVTLL